jgi:hypothetical protein
MFMAKPLEGNELIEALQAFGQRFFTDPNRSNAINRQRGQAENYQRFADLAGHVFHPENIRRQRVDEDSRAELSEMLSIMLGELAKGFLISRPTAFREMSQRIHAGAEGKTLSPKDEAILGEFTDSLQHFLIFQDAERARSEVARNARSVYGMERPPHRITAHADEYAQQRGQQYERFIRALTELAKNSEALGAERLTGGTMTLSSDHPNPHGLPHGHPASGQPGLAGMRPLINDIHLMAYAIRQLGGRGVGMD